MNPKTQPTDTTDAHAETFGSAYAGERWQGATFAASWIATPSRGFEDPTLPTREDDHA